MKPVERPWLFGPRVDMVAFLGTAMVSALFSYGLSSRGSTEVSIGLWIILVLGIDVAHVWSTLFRLFAEDGARIKRTRLVWKIAAVSFSVAWLLASIDFQLFWRVMAYVAVWHFIRQQVGWGRLYNHRAQSAIWETRLDSLVLYALTLGPVIWWHARLPRPFRWFTERDFIEGLPELFASVSLVVVLGVFMTWLGAQVVLARRGQWFWGRWGLVFATAIAWVGGIVFAPNDVTFTLMNVALHGVPYLLLLFRYQQSKTAGIGAFEKVTSKVWGVLVFIVVVWGLAYSEEWLWDQFVWQERSSIFPGTFEALSGAPLNFMVALLALPQLTHYMLDAFIWRTRGDELLKQRLGWSTTA